MELYNSISIYIETSQLIYTQQIYWLFSTYGNIEPKLVKMS